jgi:hypothetical protein
MLFQYVKRRHVTLRRMLAASAGLMLAAKALSPADSVFTESALAQVSQPRTSASAPSGADAAVRRSALPVSLIHAGSTAADVERVLGRPTIATDLDGTGGDWALLYADQPVRTHVVLSDGRVTALSLDLLYIDPAPLPPRARALKATMVHNGVVGLLGRPDHDDHWFESGRALEQMTFAAPGEPTFSVFLADGLLVDVRPGRERLAGLAAMVLPPTTPDSTVVLDLAIGLTLDQCASLLGTRESSIRFTFKGQPVEYATYREREGNRLVSLTFTGGVLTAFHIWPGSES